jgi:hypothetical protein
MFEFASRKNSAPTATPKPNLTGTQGGRKHSFDNARIRYNPDVTQRVVFDEDEDELLQGKFSDTAQRETLDLEDLEDEEEPLQGKFCGTAQLAQEETGKANRTGIPDNMKTRFENASGFSFDDVRIHYNSDAPAKLNALAYTQGNQVHIAPGQEKHLGHELGHVVQQKQGIVRPTGTIDGVPVNDDPALENKADEFQNKKPLQLNHADRARSDNRNLAVQRKVIPCGTINNPFIMHELECLDYYLMLTINSIGSKIVVLNNYYKQDCAQWGIFIGQQLDPYAKILGWTCQFPKLESCIPDYYKLIDNTHVFADLTTENASGGNGKHIMGKLTTLPSYTKITKEYSNFAAADIVYKHRVTDDGLFVPIYVPNDGGPVMQSMMFPLQQPMMFPLQQPIMDSSQQPRKKSQPWTADEDKKLLQAIEMYGQDNWSAVAEFVGSRTKSQCSQRWTRNLNPNLSKETRTEEEDEKLLQLVEKYGNKNWAKIAQQMGNRSDVQCRYHYNQLQKKA